MSGSNSLPFLWGFAMKVTVMYCEKCKYEVEVLGRSFPLPFRCPKCGGQMKKVGEYEE